MQLLRYAFGAECLVSQLEAATRGQHRVGDDEGLVAQVGGGKVFHLDAHALVFLIEIVAIGRHEGVARVVEDVEEALVEGQACAEDGGEHHLVVGRAGLGVSQRRLYGFLRIIQGLAYLVGHHLADALQVVAEGVAVGLDLDVPQLGHILVDDAVAFSEVDDFHGMKDLSQR